MKSLNFLGTKANQFALMVMATFFSVLSYAQDKGADLKVDVNTTKTTSTEEWISNPIYWVIGGVVLIIIVALIARGGGNRGN